MSSDSKHPKFRKPKNVGAFASDKELDIRVVSSSSWIGLSLRYNKSGQRARHGAKTFVRTRLRRKQKEATRKELIDYETQD